MSIEKITARILQEAQAEADALKKQAEEEAASVLAAAQAEADKITADAVAKAEKDATVLVERRKSVAELEARKMRLAAKQEMIDKSFDDSMKALRETPEDEYLAFLMEKLQDFNKGEILLGAADKARLGDKLQAKLAGTELTVSDETADIIGGFLLKNGNVFANCSIESLMHGEKTHIIGELAQILFS